MAAKYDFTYPGAMYSEEEIRALLVQCEGTRYPVRNRAVILLTTDAGLTAKEIAELRRYCVLDEDNALSDHISLLGKSGTRIKPRRIPMPAGSRLALALQDVLNNVPAMPHDPLIISERAAEGGHATEKPGRQRLEDIRYKSIGCLIWKLSKKAGIPVASPRKGRNTFILKAARNAQETGRSLRDVQALTGQRSLDLLQRYVEENIVEQRGIMEDLFGQKSDV